MFTSKASMLESGKKIWYIHENDYRGYSRGTILEVISTTRTKQGKSIKKNKIKIRYSRIGYSGGYERKSTKTFLLEDAVNVIFLSKKSVFRRMSENKIEGKQEELEKAKEKVNKIQEEVDDLMKHIRGEGKTDEVKAVAKPKVADSPTAKRMRLIDV